MKDTELAGIWLTDAIFSAFDPMSAIVAIVSAVLEYGGGGPIEAAK